MHRLTAQRVEEHRAESPDVALGVHLLGHAERLLGRHEGGRPDDVLRGVRGSPAHLREPEVEELDAASVEHHHVLRLEVSMSDALGMDRRERVHDRVCDWHHLVEGDAPAACLPQLLERLTDEELEDEERAAIVSYVVVPDLHDTGMLDCADEISLLEEQVDDVRIGREHRAEDLDRSAASVFAMRRCMDGGCRAFADDLFSCHFPPSSEPVRRSFEDILIGMNDSARV